MSHTIKIALGATLASLSLGVAQADSHNPFVAKPMNSAQVSPAEVQKAAEEGQKPSCVCEMQDNKCVAKAVAPAAKKADAKCGDAKCGDSKKAADAKCGDAKCGDGKKQADAKCGDGKCGD